MSSKDEEPIPEKAVVADTVEDANILSVFDEDTDDVLLDVQAAHVEGTTLNRLKLAKDGHASSRRNFITQGFLTNV